MERFYLEVPCLERKEEAIAYIKEFREYGSQINGAGGLNHYLEVYEDWLRSTEAHNLVVTNEVRVPAREFFLVRENDRKIVGMINIRLALNERLKKYGGHIGYSIRPTERGKGYNEAQNTTTAQMKMFLTRLGPHSKAIITGDTSQIDLAKGQVSGLEHAMKILKGIRGIAEVEFSATDVLRHHLVKDILLAYEQNEQKK